MKCLKSINLLIVVLVLFMNYSCSVEKKLYSHGYYVKWHHNPQISKVLNPKSAPNPIDTAILVKANAVDTTLTFNNDEFSVLHKSEPDISVNQKKKVQKGSLSQVSEKRYRKQTKSNTKEVTQGINMAKALVSDVKTVKGNQRMHGLAVVGFILALVGWVTPVNVALLLLILGVVFASIALGSISKNPEIYKGSGLAISTFIVALIGIIILFAL